MNTRYTVVIAALCLACGGEADGTKYTGVVSGQLLVTTSMSGQVNSTCVATNSIVGTLTLTIESITTDAVTGRWLVKAPEDELSNGGPACINTVHGQTSIDQGGTLSGMPSAIVFSTSSTAPGTTDSGGGFTSTMNVTGTWGFTGALLNGEITGTMTYSVASQGTSSQNGVVKTNISGSGATSFAVTLR